MPVINEGTTETVTVPAGQRLIVSTEGEAYLDHLVGLVGNRYSTDRLMANTRIYNARDMPFALRVRTITSDVTYEIEWPQVKSGDVAFRRDDDGQIDALIDPKSGDAIPIGPGTQEAVTWVEITGKPDFGTAATADSSDFATAADGELARSAVQPGQIAQVATSGQYDDLFGTPHGTAVPDVSEAPTADDFNALLASLRGAGLINNG